MSDPPPPHPTPGEAELLSKTLPPRDRRGWEFGMGRRWNGERCGGNLARILRYDGKMWYTISKSWHKNTHTHQILTGKLRLGIKTRDLRFHNAVLQQLNYHQSLPLLCRTGFMNMMRC